VLFIRPPDAAMLRQYPHVRAIGVAGNSRMMTPAEMDVELPYFFQALRQQQPRIVHYKVCSTFDSSPHVGSIGRAIDIGQRIFQNRFVPLLVAAPALQRFCLFGNLFARSGLNSEVYRLDRHPTMRHHPITPMLESDLRVHLSRQTHRPISLVDVLAMEGGYEVASVQLQQTVRETGSVVLFDALNDDHMAIIGQLIGAAQEREKKTLFVVGSSGVETALGKYWQATGQTPTGKFTTPSASAIPPVDRTIVLSGSCSPVTARQIAWGLAHGFEEFPLDTPLLCQSVQWETHASKLARQVVSVLESHRSVIVHTSRGPDDPRVEATRRVLQQPRDAAEKLGILLGTLLRHVIHLHPLRRVALVGGDTSGHAAGALGIDALEFTGRLEPGAPLCTARSHDKHIDGLEIVFKGGQVGYDNSFASLLSGTIGITTPENRVGDDECLNHKLV
jgi:uncharacterized protein YgbK (DUF1537 family)